MGQNLLNFLVTIIGIGAIGLILFLGLDKIARDDTFKKIAKVAIGAALLIVFILAVGAVLFGAGPGVRTSPGALLELGIGLIVILVVLEIVYRVIDAFWPVAASTTTKDGTTSGPSVSSFKDIVILVIGAVAVIALLVLAERTLFGGGLGLINLQMGNTPLVR